jgi:hypothetical protein
MELVILSQDAYQNLITRIDSLDKHVKQLVSPTPLKTQPNKLGFLLPNILT